MLQVHFQEQFCKKKTIEPDTRTNRKSDRPVYTYINLISN